MGRAASKLERQHPPAGGLESREHRAVAPISELRLLRAKEELASQLRPISDLRRVVKVAGRMGAGLFHADEACVALLEPGRAEAEILPVSALAVGGERSWDARLLASFARGERPDVPGTLALARLKRRGRAWGAIGLRFATAQPGWDVRNALTDLVGIVNQCVQEIERERLQEVRARIDRKIMEQLRPKDLFYQILDGIRSLTGYDHSGALLTAVDSSDVLEVAAEQLAWRKGKSQRVGARVSVPTEVLRGLAPERVWGYSRDGSSWAPWDTDAPGGVAELLARVEADSGTPPEAEMICAPLHAKDGLAAILKISACHPGTLGPYEAELVSAFLPAAAVALQNSRRAETMHVRMLEAERKHAMAELARGVSHDVNNALGSILPLVQQMRADLAEHRLNPGTLDADLEQIERSVRTCTRIFGGMLNFARRAAQQVGHGDLRAAVEATLVILGDGLRRRGVQTELDLPAAIPSVPIAQTELEQVFMNLVSNARDAMTTGGRLLVRARLEGREVRVHVEDTGCGVPPENLARIHEPFFTTKPHGTGLGLSICRSIVWQCQGRMTLESSPGNWTRVILNLPAIQATEPVEAGGASGGGDGG
jgi:signal transduction histidine kinase